MRLARWPLKLPELRPETPVGDSSRMITSARPRSRLLAVGGSRQSKTNSLRGSLRRSDRKAASPTGCRPSLMSKLWMVPASSTAARSRQTIPPGNSTGSPESPRETASFLHHLLGRRLHSRPSSRRPGQSAPYKMNTLRNTELMWCSPVWLMIGTADGCSSKK